MDNVTALILCGGKGERLRPLTKSVPKPLIKIKNKPILGYIIEHIQKYSINNFVFATGYQAEKIEDYLNQNFRSLNKICSNSGDVDIIRRIEDAIKYIEGDFILFYGDTLSDVNINNLIKHHKKNKGNATVTVWPLKSQFGLFDFDEFGMISSFKEKPTLDYWINIGYIYFDKSLIGNFCEHEFFQNFLTNLVKKKELNGYKHLGVHITVNTLQELELAEKNIERIGFYYE